MLKFIINGGIIKKNLLNIILKPQHVTSKKKIQEFSRNK